MPIPPLSGRFLVASPLLVDPNFHRSVVLLLEHGEDGALGVVVNRPSASMVGDHLPEWADRVGDPSVVFIGGPVQPEVAIGLGREGDEVAPIDLDDPLDGGGEVRVFAGYAGWGAGQLEAELAEEAWTVVAARPELAFDPRPEDLWVRILRARQDRTAMWSTFPDDLRLN